MGTSDSFIASALEMIDRLLEGTWDFETFKDNYYDFSLNEASRAGLDKLLYFFFSDVQEQLDWTSSAKWLDDEEISVGVITRPEYIEWLRVQRPNFRAAHDR